MLDLNETTWHRSRPHKAEARILCLDLALSRCGWSIMDLKKSTGKKKNKRPIELSVVQFGNIKASGEANKVAYQGERDRYSKRVVSLLVLRKEIEALIREFEPDHVVAEDAFFFSLFPSAYAALEQCLMTVTLLCKDKFNLKCFRVPTKSAKKSMAGTGTAGKLDVIKAVQNSPNITFRQKKRASMLDEHSADSIAVGYHFFGNIWPTLKVDKGVV